MPVGIAGIVLVIGCVLSIAGCAAEVEPPDKDVILVGIQVVKDEPDNVDYQVKEGEPDSVGVYRFYFEKEGLPGTGAFQELDSIPLHKSSKTKDEFHGSKGVKRIDGVLCVGYPPTNFIDGKACIRIDQTQDEVNVTVHYWETSIAILKKPR